MGWARDSFVRPGATVPPLPEPDKVQLTPSQLSSYEGLYTAEGGWLTCVRIVVRDGRLWIDSFDGVIPLAAQGGDRFCFADERNSPSIAHFTPASVTPRALSLFGNSLVRIGDPFLELG
jgi:hypothetical protein